MKTPFHFRTVLLVASIAGLVMMTATSRGQTAQPAPTKVPVVFTEGHETVGRDRGRPVILVAGALGVPAEVFREAFTHVHPAGPGSGGPTDQEARQNKAALMSALGPYGVTDERLNEVSNYYRYVRSRGEMWPTKPAVAYALVDRGVITGYVVTSGGSGYSSPPTVTVPSIPDATATAHLSFDKDFEKNGAVTSITITPNKK